MEGWDGKAKLFNRVLEFITSARKRQHIGLKTTQRQEAHRGQEHQIEPQSKPGWLTLSADGPGHKFVQSPIDSWHVFGSSPPDFDRDIAGLLLLLLLGVGDPICRLLPEMRLFARRVVCF